MGRQSDVHQRLPKSCEGGRFLPDQLPGDISPEQLPELILGVLGLITGSRDMGDRFAGCKRRLTPTIKSLRGYIYGSSL